jgi:hypothetical protein
MATFITVFFIRQSGLCPDLFAVREIPIPVQSHPLLRENKQGFGPLTAVVDQTL